MATSSPESPGTDDGGNSLPAQLPSFLFKPKVELEGGRDSYGVLRPFHRAQRHRDPSLQGPRDAAAVPEHRRGCAAAKPRSLTSLHDIKKSSKSFHNEFNKGGKFGAVFFCELVGERNMGHGIWREILVFFRSNLLVKVGI